MQVTFLGTSCMQPTKDRNHPSFLLSYCTENILFDCGEGTQRQLKIAGIKPGKITRLLISHWHGDHVLGIPGLIQTMGASDYVKKLHIYGPKGSKEYMKHILKVFVPQDCIDFEVHEVSKGKFYENDDFYLEALPLKHGIECLGFAFVEKDKRRIITRYVKNLGIPDGPVLGKLQQGKQVVWKGKKVDLDKATSVVRGKKISYVADTLMCDNCVKIAEDADLLICESSFASKLEEKAETYYHLTAKQAALIANHANVGKLCLTHFSQRYKDTSEVEEDAKDYFDDIICAYDFLKIKV